MEPEPQVIKLPPCYDTCLLGATVSLHGTDRFVYSLTKLVQFKMLEHQCQAPEARQIVLAEIIKPIDREHGPLAPVWVNDELVLGSIEEKDTPKIIVPEVLNGRGRR